MEILVNMNHMSLQGAIVGRLTQWKFTNIQRLVAPAKYFKIYS